MTTPISLGKRQKHAREIVKKVRSIRGLMDRIEQEAEAFEAEELVFNAALVSHLGEDCTSLIYLIGQANGAMVLPDIEP